MQYTVHLCIKKAATKTFFHLQFSNPAIISSRLDSIHCTKFAAIEECRSGFWIIDQVSRTFEELACYGIYHIMCTSHQYTRWRTPQLKICLGLKPIFLQQRTYWGSYSSLLSNPGCYNQHRHNWTYNVPERLNPLLLTLCYLCISVPFAVCRTCLLLLRRNVPRGLRDLFGCECIVHVQQCRTGWR